MLQQPEPDDFVIGTGTSWSVRDLCEEAFSYKGLDYAAHVRHSPRHIRPAEVDLLVADPSKAKKVLGWEPKVAFRELVRMMVDSDVAAQLKTRATQ